jgi:hypothetical protein
MDSGRKRKRDADCPRITYHAPDDRTFDRLFTRTPFLGCRFRPRLTTPSDSSLAEMKASVRKKLTLPPDTPLQLVQLRNGRNIDLEDGQLSSADRFTIT